MVAALMRGVDGPFNVVGPGRRERRGRRCGSAAASRCRCSGPGWGVAHAAWPSSPARPVPPHVLELMHARAGPRDGVEGASRCSALAGMRPTQEVCTELYEWATVTPLRPTRRSRRRGGSTRSGTESPERTDGGAGRDRRS